MAELKIVTLALIKRNLQPIKNRSSLLPPLVLKDWILKAWIISTAYIPQNAVLFWIKVPRMFWKFYTLYFLMILIRYLSWYICYFFTALLKNKPNNTDHTKLNGSWKISKLKITYSIILWSRMGDCLSNQTYWCFETCNITYHWLCVFKSINICVHCASQCHSLYHFNVMDVD